MPSSSSPPRIAIVGGGPAGLTMGALLQKHNIPFTIFELRAKPDPEDWALPSGMLDLHEGDGLAALKKCGLLEAFWPLTGECSQEFILCDKHGARTSIGTESEVRPEISRNNLARLLLTRIPEQRVRWRHKLVAATAQTEESGSRRVTELDFGDGGKHEFDLVVGADGAWSKVRRLVTDVAPVYSEAQIATVTIRNISGRFPYLAGLVGSGSFMALGNRQAVMSQRGPVDSARIYLWLRTADERYGTTSGLAAQPAAAAKAALLEDPKFLGTFGPVVKELVTTACDEETLDNPGGTLDIRPLYSLPYGTAWERRPGVAVIGDAAHLMLPNGEGVNQAMLDATVLSEAIIEAYGAGRDADAFERALAPLAERFEREMTERSVAVGKETEQLLGMMLGSDTAAQDMANFFKEHKGLEAKE